MLIALSVLIFLFGAIIGSFLNVVILRLPFGQHLNGRSHCPHCLHILSGSDLIPIFSFLALGRRCRYCREKISPRYFIIEIVSGLLFLSAWFYFHPVGLLGYLFFIRAVFISCILLVVFVIDLEHYLILDKIIFPALAVIMALNLCLDFVARQPWYFWNSGFMSGIIGAVAIAFIFFALWFVSKGEWLGLGDVKLSLFLGAAVGWPVIVVALFLSVLSGTLAFLPALVLGSKTLKSKIPFGTFLSAATLFSLYFGPQIVIWYLSILGVGRYN